MVNPETATNAEIMILQGPNGALPDTALLQEAVVEFDRENPELPSAIKLTIKLRSFRKIDPAEIMDRVSLQTEKLTLEMGRQYLEELSTIAGYLKLAVQKLKITLTVVVQSGNVIQSVPAVLAKLLRKIKDGMVTARASAVEIRLHFTFYGGSSFDQQDRIAVLGHSDLQEFNIKEHHGHFIVMPEVAGFQCVFSF